MHKKEKLKGPWDRQKWSGEEVRKRDKKVNQAELGQGNMEEIMGYISCQV